MPPPILMVSRKYTLENLDFILAKSMVSLIFSSVIIYSDYMVKIWNFAYTIDPYKSEIFTGCVWFAILYTLTSIIDLLFELYHNFVLEKNLEMPIMTFKQLFIQFLTDFIIIQVFSMVIAALVVKVIQLAGCYFFVMMWILCSILLSVFTSLIQLLDYPENPSLVDFPQSDLKRQIENLCRELEFPLEKIELLLQSHSMEEHSCVYYYGMFKKHLVISVNILPLTEIDDSLEDEEILALIIHQLGHWYKNHDIKKFFILQAALLIWFFLFIYAFERKVVYEAVGFYESKPILVGILITLQYVTMPYNVLMTFTLISWSRTFEYEADRFAVHLGMKSALQRALIKIYVVSFQFPVLDPLYSQHNFHHPSLFERIQHLNEGSLIGM